MEKLIERIIKWERRVGMAIMLIASIATAGILLAMHINVGTYLIGKKTLGIMLKHMELLWQSWRYLLLILVLMFFTLKLEEKINI